jgi:hypothetical protein
VLPFHSTAHPYQGATPEEEGSPVYKSGAEVGYSDRPALLSSLQSPNG